MRNIILLLILVVLAAFAGYALAETFGLLGWFLSLPTGWFLGRGISEYTDR